MVIGVTGPSGAGKSVFLRSVKAVGGEIVDCDKVYHDFLNSNIAFQAKLENEFGLLRDEEGRIDTKKLGSIVFCDSERMNTLDKIVYESFLPALKGQIDKLIQQKCRLIAIEAIHLVDSPIKDLCDLTLAVIAPEKDRIQRIMRRDSVTEDYARVRVSRQGDNAFFSSQCDVVISNTFYFQDDFEDVALRYAEDFYTR